MTRTPEQIDALVAEARGMSTVPTTPTVDIFSAWSDGYNSHIADHLDVTEENIEACWRYAYAAMLAASPTLLTDLLAVVEQLREEIKTAREDERAMTIPERIMEEARTMLNKINLSVRWRKHAVETIARAIQAAEERRAVRAIVIKPLEWEPVSDGRFSTGVRPNEARAANYLIVQRNSVYWLDDGIFTFLRRQFETMDEAKAAAQADYEARIRSALTAEDK